MITVILALLGAVVVGFFVAVLIVNLIPGKPVEKNSLLGNEAATYRDQVGGILI